MFAGSSAGCARLRRFAGTLRPTAPSSLPEVYLSFYVDGARLASLSRYTMPLFAILMRLAAWLSERRLRTLMLVNTGGFVTWHFNA